MKTTLRLLAAAFALTLVTLSAQAQTLPQRDSSAPAECQNGPLDGRPFWITEAHADKRETRVHFYNASGQRISTVLYADQRLKLNGRTCTMLNAKLEEILRKQAGAMPVAGSTAAASR